MKKSLCYKFITSLGVDTPTVSVIEFSLVGFNDAFNREKCHSAEQVD